MKQNIRKSLVFLNGVLIISLIAWVIFMILSMSRIQPDWQESDYIAWAAGFTYIDIINYGNAVIFTVLVVMLFALLYMHYKDDYPVATAIGILFVPIYGVLNLLVYASQITLLPLLLKAYGELSVDYDFIIAQLIQAKSSTTMGVINAFAYAILGIPSICFGSIVLEKGAAGITAGVLLIANALACIVGLIGLVIENTLMAFGCILGGLIFIPAIVFLLILFRKEVKESV